MMRKREPRLSTVGLAIRNVVQQQPGIHFRGLGRAARVSSAGQLRHHLDSLAHQGILVEIPDGRYKRFFVAGEHDPRLRPEMARFARVVPRRIARLLLVNPMNRTELRRSLGCADSTLGYHLTRMVMMGDLAKSRGANCCRYSLTSEDMVRKMMLLQGGEPDAQSVGNLPPGPLPVPQTDDDPVVPEPLRRRPVPAPGIPVPRPPLDIAPSDSARDDAARQGGDSLSDIQGAAF